MTNTSAPTRGERNCNPLNIDFSPANNWQGQIGIEPPVPGESQRFALFSSELYGIRAGARLLERYIARGQNTIPLIVTPWAPPSENNTEAYITSVEAHTGFTRDQIFTGTAAELEALIHAIIIQENGRCIYQAIIIMNAVNLALS